MSKAAAAAVAKTEPVIETSPIRLTVDETKIIMRLAAAGKPNKFERYGEGITANGLAALGILARIELSEEKDIAAKIADCWARAGKAMAAKDCEVEHREMQAI